jgi:predicted alpha/beta-fold hydrolase
MSIIESEFRPASWCRNPHLQTLWPYLFRVSPRPEYRRERLELTDGDFLDLDWFGPYSAGPLVLLLHGLEGCSQSHYVRGLVTDFAQRNIRSVVMHHRGCSGELNRLNRSYHAGETADLNTVLTHLHDREPKTEMGVVGFSLGGNMLLKWLGENPHTSLIKAAAAVSVPFLLAEGARRMQHGFSQIYQWRLIGLMKQSLIKKFADRPAPIDMHQVCRLKNFWTFDDQVTARLHGFADVEDYYARSSSRQFLSGINTETLIVHAADDPLMTVDVIPREHELSGKIQLELSQHGGHVGFVTGPVWRPRYWLDRRVADYLSEKLAPKFAAI